MHDWAGRRGNREGWHGRIALGTWNRPSLGVSVAEGVRDSTDDSRGAVTTDAGVADSHQNRRHQDGEPRAIDRSYGGRGVRSMPLIPQAFCRLYSISYKI